MQALDESVSEKVGGRRAQRAAGAGLKSSEKEFEKNSKKIFTTPALLLTLHAIKIKAYSLCHLLQKKS